MSGRVSVSRSVAALLVLLLTTGVSGAQTTNPPAAPPKIDLKLFEKSEIDRSKGCSFVLWQGDRDPEKDRFAYVFSETLGRNHVRENARVKIGPEVLEFKRIAVGGAREFGYKTFPSALYKAEKDDSFLIFDLKLEDSPGEVMDVIGGTMTVIRPKLPPFVVGVKGNAGCNTPAALQPKRTEAPAPAQGPPSSAALVPPAIFDKFAVAGNRIPTRMRQEAANKFKCEEAELRKGAVGYSLSEESALWEMNCAERMWGRSKIFALVYMPDPAKQFAFQTFVMPRGKERQTAPQEIIAPQWDVKNRIITSLATEGNGKDCGVFERHQLTEAGAFELIEYREKTMCDGKVISPREWPLVYQRR
jgi:hypothetical protein